MRDPGPGTSAPIMPGTGLAVQRSGQPDCLGVCMTGCVAFRTTGTLSYLRSVTTHRARGAMLYQQVASALRFQVASGALGPGSDLPGEMDLASEFSVSRYTVREALRLLETEGVIERRSGKRTRIAAGARGAVPVMVGPGVRITARLPLAGEASQAGARPGEPVLIAEYPGGDTIVYPAHQTVIVTVS